MGRNYSYPEILYVKAYFIHFNTTLNHMFLPEIKLTLSAFYDYLLTIKEEKDSFCSFLQVF